MLAKDLISDMVPALRTSDTGIQALNWMEIFRISHMPIVNNKEFLGLISDTDIYDLNMAEEPLGNHQLSLFSPYVMADKHFYDVIEIVSRLKLSVLPVLDKENHYLGLITLTDLVQSFSKITAVDNPGAIIVLELNINDYSLSEISQIVESNDARVLSLYISSHKDSTKMEVTLKINKTDLLPIIQTFNRYDYIVSASYSEEAETNQFYQNRYDSFMRYLNI